MLCLLTWLVEYIGPYLLEHVEVVWGIISPVLESGTQRHDHHLTTVISSGNAVLSLLHEVPDQELFLPRVGTSSPLFHLASPPCPASLSLQFDCLKRGLLSVCELLVLSLEGPFVSPSPLTLPQRMTRAACPRSLVPLLPFSFSHLAIEGLGRLVRVKPLLFETCYQLIFQVTSRVCHGDESLDAVKCTLLEV
jgi:hypothetical protein